MNATKDSRSAARRLAEGGVCVALAIALSYLKIPIGLAFGGFGGSIDLVMIPLILYAVRWGFGWGMAAGLVFGTVKYFVGQHAEISWVSMIFDYSVAYAFVGLAGLLQKQHLDGKRWALPLAALIGCLARFAVHYLSGVTVYAEYVPEAFMGFTALTPARYSLLYNGTYMLPNTVLAVVLCAALAAPMQRVKRESGM